MSTHMVSPPCVSWTRVIFCVFSKWQYYHALDHFLFIAHGTACRFKGKYVHTFSKLKKVIRKKLLIGLSKTKMIFWGSCQEKAPLSEALTWAKLKQKVTFAADLRGRRRKANTHNSTTVFVSSVRSSNSHPDLLLTQHPPTFSDHTGPQHWTFTFWATTAI